jgi:4-amino-4-deoxy-L-arabinose transferase-like glycosyltransferase
LILATDAIEKPTFLFFAAQMTLYTSSLLLLLLLAFDLELKKSAIILFMVLVLFPPLVDSITTFVMSESLAAFLLAAAVFLLIKSEGSLLKLTLCGILFGLVSLVRPVYQLVFIPLGIVLFIFQRSWKQVGFLAIGQVLVIGSWILFNWTHFGVKEVTLSGMNLSTRTARVLERLPEGYPMRETLLKCRDEQLLKYYSSHSASTYIWSCRGRLLNEFQIDDVELAKRMKAMNLYLIKSAPLEYLKTVLSDFVTIWFPYNPNVTAKYGRVFQLFYSAVSLSTMLLFIILSILFWSKQLFSSAKIKASMLIAVCSVLIWYTATLSVIVDQGDPRFLLPVESMIFLSICAIYPSLALGNKGKMSIT